MQTIKTFIKDHPHMWWGLYLPVYLGAFFLIEHFITDNYWATQTFIDEYIPFCEYFVIPYDSWGFLLLALGLYLIVKDAEGFRRYMWSIMLTFGFATIFCALVPNGQDLRPAVMEHHNFCTWLLQNTYNLDTNTNVLPSVHVLGVLDALYAVHRTPGLRRTGWRTFADIWGVIIICSTLFVKQHAFIDVVAALVVGAIAYVIIYTIIGGRRIAAWRQRERRSPVENIPILAGISPDEVEQMRVCFGVREERFRADTVIYDISEGRGELGLLTAGSAVIQRIDRQGGRTILEHLPTGSVFGEMLMFENVAGDSITVVAAESCRVWFMSAEHLTRRCEKGLHPSQPTGGEYVPYHDRQGRRPLRAGGGSEPPQHPGETAVLLRPSDRRRRLRQLSSALYPQCSGGLYLRRPQCHDAGAAENEGGASGGYRPGTGDAAPCPCMKKGKCKEIFDEPWADVIR